VKSPVENVHRPPSPAPAAGEQGLVVGLAASAGGLAALSTVLQALPAGFPGAVLVVQHLDPHHKSLLADILQRRSGLTVREARGGERLAPGTVYLAPPDHHLLVDAGGTLSLSSAERVRYVRPAADLLFAALAASFGPRAVAVVLSGSGRDGTDGALAVKRAGGTVIVQDVATSEFTGMPEAAIASGAADRVLPLPAIGAALVELAGAGGPP
jgi:two-component system, chemotaxis family, protein-glutamate methylesterase/glutaminase